MRRKSILLAGLLSTFFIIGCEQDSAIEDAAEATDDAVDEIRDSADDLRDEVEDAAEELDNT